MRDSNAGKRFLHSRKYCRLGLMRLFLRELGVVSLLILKGHSMKIWISESWNLVKIVRLDKNCEICLKFQKMVDKETYQNCEGESTLLCGWFVSEHWAHCLWLHLRYNFAKQPQDKWWYMLTRSTTLNVDHGGLEYLWWSKY